MRPWTHHVWLQLFKSEEEGWEEVNLDSLGLLKHVDQWTNAKTCPNIDRLHYRGKQNKDKLMLLAQNFVLEKNHKIAYENKVWGVQLKSTSVFVCLKFASVASVI